MFDSPVQSTNKPSAVSKNLKQAPKTRKRGRGRPKGSGRTATQTSQAGRKRKNSKGERVRKKLKFSVNEDENTGHTAEKMQPPDESCGERELRMDMHMMSEEDDVCCVTTPIVAL